MHISFKNLWKIASWLWIWIYFPWPIRKLAAYKSAIRGQRTYTVPTEGLCKADKKSCPTITEWNLGIEQPSSWLRVQGLLHWARKQYSIHRGGGGGCSIPCTIGHPPPDNCKRNPSQMYTSALSSQQLYTQQLPIVCVVVKF